MLNYQIISLTPEWAWGSHLNCVSQVAEDERSALAARLDCVVGPLTLGTAQFIVVTPSDYSVHADATLFTVKVTGPHSFEIEETPADA